MKKIIVVPIVAVVAAAGAASAAGFAGGVSAGPLQVGQTSDLECAKSAQVIEWGYNDHTSVPFVDNARIQLNDAECAGQAVHLIQIDENGNQVGSWRAGAKVPGQASGTQTVRLSFNAPVPAEQLKSIRISIDPGYAGMPTGTL